MMAVMGARVVLVAAFVFSTALVVWCGMVELLVVARRTFFGKIVQHVI
jgi:hypothetical protein